MLFQAGEAETPLSERWRSLATRKLAGADMLLRQAAGIRRLLARGLRCSSEDAGIAAFSPSRVTMARC